MNKRSIALLGVVFFALALGGFVYFLNDQPVESAPMIAAEVESKTMTPSNVTKSLPIGATNDMHNGDEYFDSILSGGVPKDGIPPIEEPKYMTIEEADKWLSDADRMFVLESIDGVLVYPQRVLVWHEIVNETIDGQSLSITYCPLTGSCIGYYGPENTTFGTSGRLLNSNLVMYDRESDTYWSQIMGQAVHDGSIGESLAVEPIHWATWENVKKTFDEAKVLTDETGFFRDYDRDPYGSYVNDDSYYYNNFVMFPTMSEDDRLPAKKVVVGVKGPEGVLAIDPSYVKSNGPVYDEAGGQPIIAVYDNDLEAVRVYKRPADDEPSVTDNLASADYFDVMWFAWSAFYPETELLR